MHIPDFMKKDWMKKTEIRKSIIEDTPAILKIILAAYAPIESILGRKPRGLLETEEKINERIKKETLYTVLFENDIIGTFTIDKNERVGLMEIQKVAIRPDMQNKGFGTFIMDSAEHLVRLMGEKVVVVETYQDVEQLVNFYLHRNYKTISERERMGNIVLLMEKKLWRED
ncbi:MAG: GNAT family N-acetyltransferase [Candidatus Thorarchaeota archaeon]